MNDAEHLQKALEEAAQWLALIDAADASDSDLRAFDAWKARSPRHAELIALLQGQLQQLQRQEQLLRMPGEHLLETLNAPSSRRRFLQRGASLLGLAALATLASRFDGLGLVRPGDLSSATAERKRVVLPDGSELTLNARSRVSPAFSPESRQLHLRHGELFLKVRADAVWPFTDQPLRIITDQGVLDTRRATLQVTQGTDEARLLVLAAHVDLLTRDGQHLQLQAGQRARFDGHGLLAVDTVHADETTWLSGRLRVRDQPLGEVIEALRAYRPGLIQITPEAARLRVSGIYPLDDSDLALQVLQDSLKLRITYRSAYWVSIDLG